MQKTKKHNYILTEGLGGGDAPSFLLLLNGGICKSWAKGNWTVVQARMGAKVHVDQWIDALGEKNVTFKDETVDPEEQTPVKTHAQYLEEQVESVRARLLELNYEHFGSYPQPVKDQKSFKDYTRSKAITKVCPSCESLRIIPSTSPRAKRSMI